MRYKLLIILPLIALICSSFLALNARSIDDTEGKSADQLIDESNGIFDRSGSMYPATPQEAREIELGSAGKSSSKLPSSQASSPQEARSNSSGTSDAQTVSQSGEAGANANEAQTSGYVSSLDLSGKWLLSLDDGRDLDLVLYQNGGAVFGTGSMKDGDATSLVAASGSLAGDKLKLDIVSFGAVNLYRLALTQSGDAIEGSYSAIQPSGEPKSGTASGGRSS